MKLKRMFAIAAALWSVLFASLAPATTATVNYNDMWWNPAESGWGVNIAQQGATLFLTFFVYGADSKPTWVTGILTKTGQTGSGQPVFTGDTFATVGPYYGIAFNPSDYHYRNAGTASFTPSDPVSATLTYSIDGVNVTKSIQRQTLVNDDLSGNYFGVMVSTVACPGLPPETDDVVLEGTIAQSGAQFQFQWHDVGVQEPDFCTFSGGWTQQGQLARVDGTIACTLLSGTAAMTEVASSPFAVSARVSANAGGCTLSGALSVSRR